MPRFVKSGPLVPDELVQSLEDDRVVIFCGAGISMGAGLPSYEGLVKYCYDDLAEPLPARKAPDWLWPDRMLGDLEGKFGKSQVRDAVRRCLSATPHSLDLHQAILRLATLRGNVGLRLVTTNFDTFFEQARAKWEFGKDLHSGPVLPIPRNDKAVTWRSVVYLHGRLEENGSNEHLVLTSADFGRSYLTDAWAARFVAKLFSDFTVLFVGYSLNDPVLRYMTDAFAAENSLSRVLSKRSPAYIFVPYKNASQTDEAPYRHRHLKPIFYRHTKDHQHLRKTIVAWAEAREDYLKSTLGLITRIAPKRPSSITPSDVANLVWAVCGRPADAGYGAKVFSETRRRPPLEWLEEFERRDANMLATYHESHQAAQAEGEDVPARPQLIIAPLFPPVHGNPSELLPSQSVYLARWLAQHIDDYRLAARIILKLRSHRSIHPVLLHWIRKGLADRNDLKPGLAKFWKLIASPSEDTLAFTRSSPFEALKLPAQLDNGSETLAFKVNLLSALRTAITFGQPFDTRRPDFNPDADEEDEARGWRLSEVADTKVVIPYDTHAGLLVEQLLRHNGSAEFLASILTDLTSLLRRTIDLFTLAEVTAGRTDISVFHRPSIAPHQQNRDHEKWTLLISLIWHGWGHLDEHRPATSRRLIVEWLNSEVAVLRRIGLAALNRSQGFTSHEKLEQLLDA